MRSSEAFVFVRPGLHLYSRVLGEELEEAETVVVPNASWLADAFLPLAEAAGKRRLIFYDPRSRGRSSAVSNPKQLTLEEDVADLEAVRRFYGLGRFSLIGSSYHAAIAALYTMENPGRVERLMLVCPITSRRPGEWEQETPPSEVLIYPPGVPKLDEMRREGLDRTDPVAFCRAWFLHFLLPAQMSSPAALAAFPLDDVCSFPNEWPANAMRVYFDHIVPKMRDWDFRSRLAELQQPILVVQGTDDLVPVQASLEWARHAPNSRYLLLAGSGHHPYFERPQEFFAAAEAFLGGGWPAGAESPRS